MHKLDTHLDQHLWDQYELWAKDHGPSANNRRDMARAVFRLFLAAPETLKQLAFSGRPDQMERACLYYVEEIVQELLDSAGVPPGEQGEILEAARKHVKGSRKAQGQKKVG